MAAKLQSSRDPYPFPQLQNDQDFYGSGTNQKYPYAEPTHLAQRQDPWNRLNTKCTLASSRREIYHSDPQAPNDSLDFVLKSQYNHHDKFLKAKHETLYQPETYTDDHGRVLKNREKEVVVVPPKMNHPLEVSSQKKKESIHSIKNAIESHHTQTTNRGYSRKPDGGFFSS
ncbi:protein CFAP276-like isoform X1 [Mercenaria mercenaria]|uniref:protein CFAP276-like isoform X1 n=1 Tax=Mercenaria mercenaria TaxID=6596 RepID=UPI001E1D4292|nr:protein CFAP276-like isoform X1 [Mercenaria mercenaria]